MKKIYKISACIALLYCVLIVYAYLPTRTTPAKELAGQDSQFIQIQGQNIHFIKKGEGKPLVLIHGFGGSIYTWRKLIALLAKDYTVYALDLPGFGLSDKPADGRYTMPYQADFVLSFIDALQISSPALIGHSMGGLVASYAAVKAPQKIKNIIVIEPGFYHGSAPSFLRYLFFPLQRIMAKSFYTATGRSKSLIPSYYNKAIVTDEVLEAYLQAGRTPNAIAALAGMMRTSGNEVYEGVSTQITTPALLIWSRNNKNNPLADGERLQKEIKGSQLIIIEDSGHYVQEEKPDELAGAIRHYLNT
ncbi:MAG: alpha/beta hydrolase [Pseudomonadota bacterium]